MYNAPSLRTRVLIEVPANPRAFERDKRLGGEIERKESNISERERESWD